MKSVAPPEAAVDVCVYYGHEKENQKAQTSIYKMNYFHSLWMVEINNVPSSLLVTNIIYISM